MVNADDPYDSPCVHTCVIDQHTQLCVGCGRTLTEISYWTRYTPDQRRQILSELSARQAKFCPTREE